MWNIPTAERLIKIPNLYDTEEVQLGDKLVYLHFFIFDCDWYIVEFDGHDLFFGYAILNGDHRNAEWGYIPFSELKGYNFNGIQVDCELEQYWQIKKASLIDKIRIHE